MPTFRAVAIFTTYADICIEAKDADEAWAIADAMDGGDFRPIESEGGWDIEILAFRP